METIVIDSQSDRSGKYQCRHARGKLLSTLEERKSIGGRGRDGYQSSHRRCIPDER